MWVLFANPCWARKHHTVMAEGGVAAALGNMKSPDGMNEPDSWKVHLTDTFKGGAFLNNPRTVEIFAKEAPERVLELEQYGAVFDRTCTAWKRA